MKTEEINKILREVEEITKSNIGCIYPGMSYDQVFKMMITAQALMIQYILNQTNK